MYDAVFTGKELAEMLGVKTYRIKASAKKLGYKSGPYSIEECKAIKAHLMRPKKLVFYRVSVKDFDGKCYVKHAGLTKKAALKMVELYAEQYLKAVAIPCNSRKETNGKDSTL